MEDQSANEEKIKRKITSEPAGAVGGISGIDMFHFLVGLVPCDPVCRLLPTFGHRDFPSTLSVVLPAPVPLPRTVDARHCLLSCDSSSYHLTMNPSSALRTLRTTPPPFCSGDHSGVLNSKQGGLLRWSVDGSELPN